MTPPTRFRFLDCKLKRNITKIFTGKYQKNWNQIPFFQPGSFRWLIGGVMTPPLENTMF